MGYSNGQLESEVQGGRGEKGDTGLPLFRIHIYHNPHDQLMTIDHQLSNRSNDNN